MSIANIDEHKAKVCDCGSVNFAILKTGDLECNKCQVRAGYWVSGQINTIEEIDIRHERIIIIESLKESLSRIADPLNAMIEDAKKDGAILDSGVAINISNDADMLKNWAKVALSDIL